LKTLGGKIERQTSQPAYRLVRERLLGLIQDGTFPPGSQLPAEPDIARILGVSRMTANRALNDLRSAGVLIRQKGKGTFVQIRDLDTPTLRVAILLNVDVAPAYDDSYFSALFWGLHNACNDQGINLDIYRMTPDLVDGPQLNECHGVIAVTPEEPAIDDLLLLRRRGTPVVVLGASWNASGLSAVDSDNVLGASLAINHLADQGATEILFVGGYPEASNTVDRVRGYEFAMKSRGLKVNYERDIFMVRSPYLSDQELAHLVQGVVQGERPRAIFAAGPRLAFQLVHQLQHDGMRLPEDVRLVGYDDPSYLSFLRPSVSTVRQPLVKMAEESLRVLRRLIETGDPRDQRHVLDPSLVVRGSSHVAQSVARDAVVPRNPLS
jgi:DNA-binding LacI/PurR family transcriptional regulator